MTPFVIRVWCDRHHTALVALDGPPFGDPVGPDDDPRGLWEVDLSDMTCPAGNECGQSWSITVVPPKVQP